MTTMENDMKITNMIWFTQMGSPSTIGVVMGEDDHSGEKKAYIGTGEGLDEKEDAQHISKFGAKLRVERLKEMVKFLDS